MTTVSAKKVGKKLKKGKSKKALQVPTSLEGEMGVIADGTVASKELDPPVVTKKKKKKKNKIVNKNAVIEEESVNKNAAIGEELEVGCGIKTKILEQAVEGVRHLENQRLTSQLKKDLLDDDSEESIIYLQVAMVKVAKPLHQTPHIVRPVKMKVLLPNPVVNSSTDVLLITKDSEDGRDVRDDHSENLYHYQRMLKLCGAARHISEVVTLRQLKAEFKEYEAKRHLANRTDVVLCDDTIVRRIPMFLGKHFYGKRKFPIPVNLKAKNLLSEIERCLRVQILCLPMKGNSGIMKIGCFSQSNKMIVENIQEAVQKMLKQFPGGWNNVQALYLKTERSKSVPFYAKLRSPNDIQNITSKPLSKKQVVYDEVTSAGGHTFTVYPDNTVRFTGRYSEARSMRRRRKEEALEKQQSEEKTSNVRKKNKRSLKAADEEVGKKKNVGADDNGVAEPAKKKKKTSASTDEKASMKKNKKQDKKSKKVKDELDSDVEDEKRLNKMEVDYLKRLKSGVEDEQVKNVPSDDEYDDWAEGSDEDLEDLEEDD
ncbi:ribosomal L1 domain-containing protein 1-like [Macrobrachium nipponense]|uniref:ribosomal L1 domain-containing protein 1-like n=1 Tax=Macrobrachium nipponense TaxID=159736 RepID=UPI0030C8B181